MSQVAASVTLAPTSLSFASVDDTASLVPTVRDANDNVMSGATVTWAAVSGATSYAVSVDGGPWQVVAGADPNFRTLTVASTISGAITKRLAGEHKRRQQAVYADELGELPRVPNVLIQMDMNQQLAKKNYRLQLEKYQGQLYRLVQRAREQNRSTILVF